MGVPVVTLVGPTAMGRAGLSQLMNLGLAAICDAKRKGICGRWRMRMVWMWRGWRNAARDAAERLRAVGARWMRSGSRGILKRHIRRCGSCEQDIFRCADGSK